MHIFQEATIIQYLDQDKSIH